MMKAQLHLLRYRRLPWLRRVPWLSLWLLLPLTLVGNAQAALPEYEVKAAIIYKISRFVTWPAAQEGNRPFNLCVLGNDPFESALDVLTGQTIKSQKIAVLRLPELAPATVNCDIAFISAAAIKKLPEILTALKGHAILTISDSPGFARSGGMFGLVTRDNKIVFEINIAATRAAGIEISSQLLQLATIIDGRSQK
jgi:YfiR/HmsC-like